MTDFRPYKLLLMEVILFVGIQFFGIFVAKNLINKGYLQESINVSPLFFLISFAIATTFFFLAIKFVKHGFLFKVVFLFLVFVGSRVVFSAFFPETISLALALIVLGIWFAAPYIIVHDAILLVTLAGVGSELGLSINVYSVLLLFAVLSIYDVFAVYKTRHMITMFKKLTSHGVFLALIIPFDFKKFFLNTKKAEPGRDFLMLGTGDIAFPILLAVSALSISFFTSICVIIGSTAGLILIFYMLLIQPDRKAMPALPPIALGSFLGFLVSLIIQSFL